MYTTRTLLGCTLVVLLASSCSFARDINGKSPRSAKSGPNPANRGLDLMMLPQNVAVFLGSTVTFSCWVNATTVDPRIQWTEYAHTPAGGLISDGSSTLPEHPQSDRYSLNRTEPLQYDLIITDVTLADGGVYSCADANAVIPVKQRHAAQLIVIAAPQNCTTTIRSDGSTMEGQYYTTECLLDFSGNIVPYLRWSGPQPSGQAQSNTATRCWSGVSFYAQRTMNNQLWTSQANFTGNFLPVPVDTAGNIPDFLDLAYTPRISVNWPPKDMYADPVKPLNEYLVGDQIECHADAFPTASFEWHNLRTNERLDGSLLIIPDHWLDTDQSMRCQATNTIDMLPWSSDLTIQVRVRSPQTEPPTTTPAITTPVPAVSNCHNLQGRWESRNPLPAHLCIEVNATTGRIHGVVRNDTDTFWVDLVGLTDMADFAHTTWTGIWPQNRAVSTFIGECSRCFGVEHLLVSAISRTKGGPPCATPGEIFYSQEYEFVRNPTISCPPITIPTFFNE